MITKQHIHFVEQLIVLNANKGEVRLSEDLKETYRYASKDRAVRKQFVAKARMNSQLMKDFLDEENLVELFKMSGRTSNMIALAELLKEYSDFQKWLSKNIGEPL